MLNYTKEQIIEMYYNMTVRDWARTLGLSLYKAEKLVKQLGVSKLPGPKAKPFEFKED